MISLTEFEGFKKKKFDVVSAFIEHGDEILMLHRQDHKPQGNTWAMVAGKVSDGEELLGALRREVKEEIGLETELNDYKFFESYFVRYPGYDYIYHIYRLKLPQKPALILARDEHKDHRWLKPSEALNLELIEDEDYCIKRCYGV